MPHPAPTVDSRVMTIHWRAASEGLGTETWLTDAYVEHRSVLVARARRVVVDPHLAEDVVQEAYLRAWRARSRFDPRRGPVRQWLLAITANVAKDHVKARVRRRTDSLDDPGNVPGPGTDGSDPVVDRVDLVEALGVLSEDHRDAVVHTFLLGRPYAEVAEQLGVPPGTLRSRVYYALRRLRTELEPAC